MLNYVIPIVLFCAVGDVEGTTCDGRTAIEKHTLQPEATPMSCLKSGMEDAAKYISDFKTEHPNKELEFHILCKSSDKV